ncbi:DUF1642 domain-containing protein [Lactococcus formosensis]|uniref:DUF1642 domain-containing protein n=1 Tax=Lactococcus formosensis TaxID=1281486 RepID=UPI0024359C7C|nr:DUF1642 domain-containing protein [Lactococcus formosensis]MDG6176391.1 DUF1642 domain-containing protein [Lactococcus formosensis]
MKKFEEEFDKNIDVFHVIGHHNGMCCSADKAKAFGHGWISPEDHQAEIAKLNSKIDWLHGLLDERNEEVLQTVKRLNEAIPEIPEVPLFVAEWYEENKGSLDYMIFETCRNLTDESTDEFENWFGYDNNKAITTLVNMKNGYTVKEKRFYLKHKLTGQFLAKRNQKIEHQKYFFWTGENPLTHSIGTAWELKFTQKEIDSMGADSYEQIDVGDD